MYVGIFRLFDFDVLPLVCRSGQRRQFMHLHVLKIDLARFRRKVVWIVVKFQTCFFFFCFFQFYTLFYFSKYVAFLFRNFVFEHFDFKNSDFQNWEFSNVVLRIGRKLLPKRRPSVGGGKVVSTRPQFFIHMYSILGAFFSIVDFLSILNFLICSII